ncbi:MAG: PhzF family phenazine biosynthesis isomerase [Woeseiaceae bacterium]|nr:PhzF family phenazine biosynthesis isomerase [Woeseiaceae bacterium]NIP22200.1 PhzF family phenazine biosynthesis isomerase [Woeseiaceae bacterium]
MRCLTIDAFSDKPFAGNPAAVCLLGEERDTSWMQAVAREMNLSETAFVRPADGGFLLRWFTPLVEVDLCGHATLAAAHALWEEGIASLNEDIRFQTRSGELICGRREGLLEIDFPSTPAEPSEFPDLLSRGLGVTPQYCGRSQFDALILVESEQQLRTIDPDFRLLRDLPYRGIIVTSAAEDPRFDFVSRFFAPRVGIDEDPVTGSAHCALAPFWHERLGKPEMRAYQASRRGGEIWLRLEDERVIISGKAVTVLRSMLLAEQHNSVHR